ncbi:recombinase family protein [Streptomyces anthocyanicus]|uniref:recombinase family protein n=1 Tax=Streptomyces anthocyanicus TaxID=68174 RepID=UPI00363D14FA
MKPQRAVLLLRISYRNNDEAADNEQTPGMSKGINRQEADGRAYAERLGWSIARVIIEDDTSAFKRRRIKLPDGSTALRTVRPGFREALDLLSTGACDGLLADDLDRVARDPRDLEDLIDVVEAGRTRLPVESVTGSLRLANDADVTMARVMVAVANKSSRDTARRVSRKHEELATAGKVGGGGFRPYGYERDGVTVREHEATVIRWMADRITAGATRNQVANALNRCGIPPAKAGAWNSRSVVSILTGPRIAGLRRFRREIIGEATWPAILPRDVWEDVQERLKATATTRPNFARWLTGALVCSLCERKLMGWQGNSGPRYWCAKPKGGCGRIAIHAGHAEAEVERQILALLADPGILSRLRSLASSDTGRQARTDLAADEAQLKELAGAWARREITFPEYTEARRIIDQRMRETRALVTSHAPRVLRLLLADDVAAGWKRLEPADRRDVLLALTPGYVVQPAAPGMGRFDPGRLVPIEA